MMNTNKPNRNLRYPALVTVFAYCWQLLFLMASGVASAADVVPANVAAGKRPIIDAAINGTPIVHIAPPNSTGLSHNQYQTLNVPQKGLILNNSSAPIQTQLGGWVSGNLQLGTVPARIILNEVVSSNPSQFMGTLEVAGQKADIVVANPNGITCDGCGFINSDRATLTTGTPNINGAGRLQGFDVKQGAISVTGDGLNATQLEQLDLLARGIVIEGEVWAKDLQVLTGSNQILYADLSATEINGQGTAPRFAIDIKNVGGMYANTIHLIATEDGLGVNSTGRIAALTGDLVLSANGDLSLKETHAQNTLSLSNTGDITLAGDSTAATLQINSSGDLTNNATAEANALTFEARNISNSGVIHQTAAQSTTRLQADGAISNTGHIYSKAAVVLSSDTLNDQQGSIASEQSLAINAREIALNGTRLARDQAMTLRGNRLSADTATVTSDADLTIGVQDTLTTDQGTWQATGTIRIDAKQVTNQDSDIAAGEQLRITSDEIVNRGNLSAQGSLDITTERLTSENGVISSLDRLTLTAEHISNTGGLIQSAGDMRITTTDITNQQSGADRGIVTTGNLTLSAQSLDNSTGRIASRGPQSLTLSGALNNSQGLLQSESDLTIQAGSVNATEGSVIAEGDIKITTTGDTTLNQATLYSGKALTLSADNLSGDDAELLSQGNLTATAKTQQLTNSTLNTQGDLTLKATRGTLDLTGSDLSVTGSANLNASGAAITENAQLVAGKNLQLTSTSLNNKAGTLAAGVDGADSTNNTDATLNITTGTLDNSDGQLANQAGDLTINMQGQALNNQRGTIQSSKDLELTNSGALNNTDGTLLATGAISATVGALDNTRGLVQASEDITLDSQGRVTNTDTRTSGGIVTRGKLTLDASELVNQQGYIASGKDQKLTLSSTLNNTSGEILSTQALTLSANRIENGSGSIKAHGLTDITTDTFNNQQGELNTEGQLKLQAKALDNTGGTLSANGDFTLTSEADQLVGAISSQQDLTINITGDLNNSAALSAQQALTLSADGITHSSSGTLSSGDSVTVNGDSLVNQGEITSESVELNLTGKFTNEAAGLIDATNTTITADQLDNNGRIYGDDISLNSRLINNLKDAVVAARNYLEIGTDTLENTDGAMLYSLGNLDIEGQTSGTRASRVANDSSLIEADGNVQIAADVLENTNSKLVLGSESEPTAYRTYDQYGIPGWNPNEDYRETQEYTDVERDTVSSSQPGEILAGGNINLEGSSVLNHDSKIVAGQTLSSTAALTNREAAGVETTTRHGQHRMVWLSSGGWRQEAWQTFNEVTTAPIPLNITQSLQGAAARAYLNANGNTSPAGSQAAIKSDVELATHRVQGLNLKDLAEGSASQALIDPQATYRTSVESTALTVQRPAPLYPPSNKLFVLNISPQANYLVETDPRFTRKQAFLSSDYMLEKLAKDPSRQLKRYGDGFYEQKLLTDQITAMTGRRYLPDYRSSEAQYTALMDAGVTFASTYQLTPGVALSAAQMTLLTSDIVWLVETSVVLPDGSTETVLAPQVYLRNLEQGDLHTSGVLVSARDIDIKSTASITNEGTLLASDSLALRTDKGITNLGTIKGLKSLTLNAQDDILNQAGRFQGGQISGGDVSLTSRAGSIKSLTDFKQTTTSNSIFTQVGKTRAAIQATGDLSLKAGKNIEFQAADASATGNLDLSAGNDIQLETVQERHRTAYVWGNGHVISDKIKHHASTLTSGQDQKLSAGRDLNLRATEVTASGNLALNAGNDLNLLAANDEDYYSSKHIQKKSFGRKKSGFTEIYSSKNRGVTLKSGKDLRINLDGVDNNGRLIARNSRDVTIDGAEINVGGNALITAKRDINLTPGSQADYAYSKTSNSGFGGFSKKQSVNMAKQTEVAPTRITTQGDNLIQAGGDLTALAADISSKGVTQLSALGEENIDNGSVNLLAGQNSRETFSETKKSKFGLSISNNMLSIASEKVNQNTQLDISNVATRIDGQEGIQVEARKDINIVGSELQSEGDIQLSTVEGDINIAAGVERHATEQRQSTSRKGIGLSSDSNGISLFVGEETVAERNEWEGVTLAGSQLSSGGDTKLQAGNDANIVASDIVAAENVEISAVNDIRVRTEQEVYRTLQENSVTRDGLTVTLQHNYGKTRDALSGAGEGEDGTSKASSTLAAIDAIDSFLAGPTGSVHLGVTTDTTTTIYSNTLAWGSQIVAGNDVLLDAENDVELQAARIIALNDTRINAKNIELTAVQNTNTNQQQVTHESDGISLEGSKSSARAGVTFANGKTEYTSNQGVASVTSIESGNNVNLSAEQDLRIEGSQISAGNIQLNAGNDLEITVAETTSDSRFNDKQTSGGAGIGATVNSNGAAFGVNVHLAYAKNKLDRDGTQQQNAQINTTDTLEFSSGEDTRIQGANLEAEHIKGSVGGDLTVSSVQDTGKADGERKDANIDVTVGYGYSVSGGIGYGETEGEKQWVEQQTSIIGRESVELNTENHTQIDAALIAQIDEQGNDGGNLSLNTGSLGHTDLKDYDQEITEYLHVNGSLSQNGNGSEGGSDDNADGSSGWGVQGQDYEKDRQQITRATLGEGTINIASENSSPDSINRDINRAQELLKDEESNTELYITSNSIAAVEGMFTEDDPNTPQNENTFGRWADELGDYGSSTVEAMNSLQRATETTELVAAALIQNGVNGEGIKTALQSGAFKTASWQFAKYHPEVVAVLLDNNASVEDKQAAEQAFANVLGQILDIDEPMELDIIMANMQTLEGDGSLKGATNSEGTIYIDHGEGATSISDTGETARVIGHEVAHNQAGNTESTANTLGNAAEKSLVQELGHAGLEAGKKDKAADANWIANNKDSQLIQKNNRDFLKEDPSKVRFYNEAGHYYTTYYVALRTGYSAKDARTMALHSQLPDEVAQLDAINNQVNAIGNQVIAELAKIGGSVLQLDVTDAVKQRDQVQKNIHSLTGKDAEKAQALAKNLLKEAKSPEERGVIIHFFADTFAHTKSADATGDTFDTGIGHGLYGTDPDLIHRRPQVYKGYVEALSDTLAGLNGNKISKSQRSTIANELLVEVSRGAEDATRRVALGQGAYEDRTDHTKASDNAINNFANLLEQENERRKRLNPQRVANGQEPLPLLQIDRPEKHSAGTSSFNSVESDVSNFIVEGGAVDLNKNKQEHVDQISKQLKEAAAAIGVELNPTEPESEQQ